MYDKRRFRNSEQDKYSEGNIRKHPKTMHFRRMRCTHDRLIPKLKHDSQSKQANRKQFADIQQRENCEVKVIPCLQYRCSQAIHRTLLYIYTSQ